MVPRRPHRFSVPSLWLSTALLIISLSVGTAPAPAQPVPPEVPSPTLTSDQFVHAAWQAKDGLPQNSVYSITQTNDGYLWFATQEGLVRFDGVKFTIFDKQVVDVLANNQITDLLEARDGTFWIGTEGSGLLRYAGGRFEAFTTADGLSGDQILTLFEDSEEQLWIGAIGEGLSRYDGTSFDHFGTSDGLTGSDVLSIAEEATGTMWIGTQAGLTRFEDGTLQPFPANAQLPGNVVRSLLVDRNGVVWIGTNDGLARYEDGALRTYTAEDGLCGNYVSSLFEDAAGTLWIGTHDKGVCQLKDDTFASFSTKDGLTHDRVRSLFQDREGSLWIGTDGGGLNQLRVGKFETPEELLQTAAWSVLEDRRGRMWVGTEEGLYRLADFEVDAHYTTADGLTHDMVISLYEDHRGTLWMGTYGGGLCRREAGTFTCYGTEQGLPSDFVYSIQDGADGELWLGTQNGLSRLQDGTFTTFTTKDGLSHNLISALHRTREGTLLIGTYGGGLSSYRDGTFVSFNEEYGFPAENVLTIHEDAGGTLWIGTEGNGLCRIVGTSVDCYTTHEGLPNDNVLQILEDDRGRLWLGSQKGIAEIPKDVFEASDEEPMHIGHAVTQYDRSDGLQTTELNGGTQPPAWKSSDGRLWFSTIRGIAVIDPANIPVNQLPPPVAIEALLVDGEAVPFDGAIELPPGSRDFEFQYTGLSLVAPDKVQFRYMLEGYDEQWKDAGTRRNAYYTNLSPGEYQFRVQAANSDDVWNESGAVLTFYVTPHFYQTPWFFLVTALSILALGTVAYRLRIRHLRARERKLQLLVDEQTRELLERERELESLNQHLEEEVQRKVQQQMAERERYERELLAAKEKAEASARMKSTILTNMTHEIRTPISSILGFAQILADELDERHQEFLAYIQANGKRLLDTINSILELSRLESDRAELTPKTIDVHAAAQNVVAEVEAEASEKGLTLRLHPMSESTLVRADRSALERCIQNLVNNAIKFTEEGEILLRAGTSGQEAYLRVEDTGIGISDQFLPHLFEAFKQESSGTDRSYEGNGLGLAITQRLTEAMGGRISVSSKRGDGSVFTIFLPLVVRENVPS